MDEQNFKVVVFYLKESEYWEYWQMTSRLRPPYFIS